MKVEISSQKQQNYKKEEEQLGVKLLFFFVTMLYCFLHSFDFAFSVYLYIFDNAKLIVPL